MNIPINASIAVKWVIEEDGTAAALMLRQHAKLIAPDLLVAECANIFWKKVQRGELIKAEAFLAARLLQAAEIELLPSRSLLEAATRIAVELDHPRLSASILRWRLSVAVSLSLRTSDLCGNSAKGAGGSFAIE